MAIGTLLVFCFSFFLPVRANFTQYESTTSLVFNYTESLQFKQIHSRFSTETPFLTLYNLAVNNCVYECQIRSDCEAVNFWRTRKQCDLLSNDTSDLDRPPAGRPCTYIRKNDIRESLELNLSSICPKCNLNEACDVDTGQCVIRECRNNTEPNATYVGNVLSVGAWITLKCNKWYVPETFVHDKRAPMLRSQCQSNGTWSDFPPCVYRFDCGLPPELPNATAISDDKYVGKPKSKETNVATYKCNSGYDFPSNIKSLPLFCYYNISGDPSNVSWAEPEFRCLKVCPNPAWKPNARINWTQNLEDMTRTYYCSPGYVLNTTGTWNDTMELSTTCQANGEWTNVPFECLPVCGDTPEITHGRSERLFTDGNRTFLEYTCDDTYAVTAPYTAKVECLNGTWEDPYFQCVRDCYQPPEIAHAALSDGDTLEGTTRNYTCHPGYHVNDSLSASTTCQPNGTWTSPVFNCDTVCGPVPVIISGYLIDTAIAGDHTLLQYACYEGYMKTSDISNISVECLNGTWDQTHLGCIRNCLDPPDILSAKVTLDGGTLDGAVRNYTCDPGFVLNGTGTATCQSDGNWTGDIKCLANCSAPPYILNASVTLNAGTLEGAVRNYTCDPGFVLNGTGTMTCQPDGNWHGNIECLVDCDVAPAIPNARVTAVTPNRGNLQGAMMNYTCYAGFVLNGTGIMTCHSDGIWHGVFECLADCFEPPVIYNATISLDGDTLEGAMRNYTCNPGFVLNGTGTITCQPDGNWTGDIQCLANCSEPPIIPNADVDLATVHGGTLEGAVRNYTCNHDFVLNGTGTVTCQSDGNWTGDFKCLANCFEPPDIRNATVSLGGGTLEGTVRNYTCDQGFALNGTGTMACQPDGNWTGDFECLADCSLPPDVGMSKQSSIPEQGSFGWHLEGATITYTCETGWVLTGPDVEADVSIGRTICQPDGTWTSVRFECISVCAFPPSLSHAVVADTFTYIVGGTTTAEYFCIDGYSPLFFYFYSFIYPARCSPPGPWIGPGGMCLRDCYEPPRVQNATVSEGLTVEGSTRIYTCNIGFCSNETLPYSINCQTDGNWTSPMLECAPICGRVPEVSNGSLVGTTMDGNRTFLEYTCDEGYVMITTNKTAVECLNETWDETHLGCLRKCSEPPIIHNATVTLGGTTIEGAVIDYTCDPGFVLNGTGNMTCQSDGNWLGDLECITDVCPVGWQRLEGACYFLDDSVVVDASNVLQYCQTDVDPNSFMLHVETAEKQALVEQLLQKFTASSWCLGLHNPALDGNWVWAGSNNQLSYSNWKPTQPNNYQFVAKMKPPSYQWQDTDSSCTPVCEISASLSHH